MGLSVALLGVNFGCSSEMEAAESALGRTVQPVSASSFRVELRLPQGHTLENVAFHAASALRLADGVTVADSVGAPAALVNIGTGALEVGAEGRAGTLVSGGNILLRSRSVVTGGARAAGIIDRQSGATITGDASSNTPLGELATLAFTVEFPTLGAGVTREPDKSITLMPGGYQTLTLKSRSIAHLSAGNYYFDAVQIEPQARLNLDTSAGPVLIYVRNQLDFKGSVSIQGPSQSFFLGYFGTDLVSLESAFDGTILAPHATLRLTPSNGAVHRGSFFAKQIEAAEARSKVTFAPFRFWHDVLGGPPVAPPYQQNPPPPRFESVADFPEFRDWFMKVRSEDLPNAQRAVARMAGNDEVASAVIAEFQAARATQRLGRGLMMLSLLGGLRATTGTEFFIALLDEAVPEEPPNPRGHGNGWTPRSLLLAYQQRAVHGLGFARTAAAQTALLNLISDHPEAAIRSEAVRTARFSDAVPLAEIAAQVRPGEERFLDHFERRDFDGTTFGERMDAYLAKHPVTE